MGTEEGPGASRASSPTGDSDDSDVGVATEDSGWGAAAPMRCMRHTDHSGNWTTAGGAPVQRCVAAVRASTPCPLGCASARAREASSAIASAAEMRDKTSASPMLQSLMVPSTPAEAMAEQQGEKSTERTASRWPRSPAGEGGGQGPRLCERLAACAVGRPRRGPLWESREGQL